MKSKYSNFSNDQIAVAEQAVVDAQTYYKERLDAYDRAIKSAGRRWADKNKLPLVQRAEEALEAAKDTLQRMMQIESSSQGVELVDLVIDQANKTESETSIPWGTIGLTIIILILIAAIYYIL